MTSAAHQSRAEVLEVDRIVSALRNARFRFRSEAQLCDGIEIVLRNAGICFQREHRLDADNRLDFWVPGFGLCIEVKTKRSIALLLRQLERYAGQPEVRCILVVTSKMQLAALPSTLNNKPLRVQPLVGVI